MKTTDPWLREPKEEIKYEIRFSFIDYFLIFGVVILSAKWVVYAMWF